MAHDNRLLSKSFNCVVLKIIYPVEKRLVYVLLTANGAREKGLQVCRQNEHAFIRKYVECYQILFSTSMD